MNDLLLGGLIGVGSFMLGVSAGAGGLFLVLNLMLKAAAKRVAALPPRVLMAKPKVVQALPAPAPQGTHAPSKE